MRKILMLLFFSVFSPAGAQTPAWQWVNKVCNYYTPNSALATDPFGNVYIAGRYYNGAISIGTHTLTEAWPGSENLFMVKYDPQGNIIWAKRIAASLGAISVTELKCDKAGHVYIGGNFGDSLLQMGSQTFTSQANSYFHSFAAKFKPDGNPAWIKTMDASQNELSDIDIDTNGNVILIGSYWDQALVVGTSTLNLAGYWNIFMIKYDQAGNLVWAKREGNAQFGFAGEVACDAAGNFYMRHNSNGNYIYKFDAAGTLLWTRAMPDAVQIHNHQLTTDSRLNIYYTADDTLHKLDGTGNLVYKKKLGQGNITSNTGNTQIRDMETDAQDHVYLCGYFSYASMTIDTCSLQNPYYFVHYVPQYGNQLFVVKLDPSGNALWLKGTAGAFHHQANALSIDPLGNTLIAGQTSSATLSFDNKTMNSSSPFNSFVAKLGSGNISGISGHDAARAFAVYPNPAGRVLHLQYPGGAPGHVNITLYNALSQPVYSKRYAPGEHHWTLSLEGFPGGIYFVELSSNTGRQTKKILVE